MKQLDNILFVCADEAFHQKLSEIFKPEIYQLTTDVDDAFALIAAGYLPDLIVVDLVLPKLTGAETLDQLQKKLLPKAIPGIIMTNNDRLVLYSLARIPELLGVMSKKGESILLYERIKKLWDDYQTLLVDGEPMKSILNPK
ncbi:response regulator [Ignatzschineria rhizosphaerae]|uniref:Response regulator n=1 Tax=Ignatzschineria rhizosphaerae TaxID=2923279 RepID=A0ABY3WZV8_9GAMM|nr:response regulator [Ignatzschineria rhizosphaerae]UNM96173.1 response regulator [Ignatzschineria rhizosphaerae]